MSWYYARGDEQVGPVEESQFQQLVNSGEIAPETLVWRQGMADWQPYHQVAQPRGGASAPPIMEEPRVATSSPMMGGLGAQSACAECGRVFPVDQMLEYQGQHVCAACKPMFFQRVREGATGVMEYAGFWIRVGAYFIDGIILWVAMMVISFSIMIPVGVLDDGDGALAGVAALLLNLFSLALGVTYETFFIGRFGATPGKMACGLRVVTSDGGDVSYMRAFARYFAKILSGLILGIGYIMVAFDDQKRGLHDHICDTRVIRK